MDSALAWIGQVANWFGQFFPRWIILNTTQGAVKFVRGSRPVILGPGIHWYWPAVTEVKEWIIAMQPVDLPTQTIVTSDGKTVAVGGAVIFRIRDIGPLLTDVWDPDKTIRVMASTVIRDVCSEATWDELRASNGALQRELKRAMGRRLRRFGVVVITATINEFGPCRVLKVLQSTSQDFN
jgi:regulator of protease activity HflC (stomatin/prohibitin superfamily)